VPLLCLELVDATSEFVDSQRKKLEWILVDFLQLSEQLEAYKSSEILADLEFRKNVAWMNAEKLEQGFLVRRG
jgi:hypothetical protein